MPRSPRRRFGNVLLLPALLTLQGCLTMGLWGFEWREYDDARGDEEDGRYVQMRGTRWEWWRVLLRIAATPLTLAADAALAAAQDELFGGGDSRSDDSCDGRANTPGRAILVDLPQSPQPTRRPLGRPMISGARR